MSVYPNPTKDNIFIRTETDLDVTLTDLLGKIIMSKTYQAGDYVMDVSCLENGIYFLNTIIENQTETTKLIKN